VRVSKFGQKFIGGCGILQLMDDLGSALASGEKMIMLGGGNPSHIPQVQAHFRERMSQILDNDSEFERMVGNYGPPQGEKEFIEALAGLLRKEYGWQVQPKNIALTNGSQTAFFCLFNLFAGLCEDGSHKKILLPLAPEYIGYLDLGLTDDFFMANKPEFEYLDNHLFKYHVDFDAVNVTDDIGAICVSRPTNPTGNVLTDAEIEKLCSLAQDHDIPLIIDNAYGTPFPNIIFTEARPVWNEHIVLCMSLSKLGLPGVRTGIIIADERIVAAIAGMNAVISLTPGSLGPILTLDLVKTGKIIQVSRELIKPHYQRKAEWAVAQLQAEMKGLDVYIHKPEGAFFLWLWFKGLPVTSQELYQRLKQRKVIVVPGEYFFPGIQEIWPHKYECLRMSYAQDETTVKEGIAIIAEEVKRVYDS
jgi:valine--pyruvate aminotransferase